MKTEREYIRLQDEINELKLENATLRRELLVQNASRCSSSVIVPGCSMCVIQRAQVEKLTSDLQELKLGRSDVSMKASTDVNSVAKLLEKERFRRMRLETIAKRQQSFINEFRDNNLRVAAHLASNKIPDNTDRVVMRYSQNDYDSGSSDASSHAIWEMDIDDLNRQLDELSQNVQRVEEASNRIHPSS